MRKHVGLTKDARLCHFHVLAMLGSAKGVDKRGASLQLAFVQFHKNESKLAITISLDLSIPAVEVLRKSTVGLEKALSYPFRYNNNKVYSPKGLHEYDLSAGYPAGLFCVTRQVAISKGNLFVC
jgi:hypothetical protein